MAYQYKREPLGADEADKLMNACNNFREKFVVWTLLETGLRVGELANLKKGNVLWQEKRLMIYGKGGPYGKKTKRRIIPLTNRAKPLIDHYFAEQDEVDITPRTIQRIIKEVANRAGISKKVSPHVLRHTFSVLCVKRGISTRSLQAILGHDKLATTEIYLNLSPEDVCREFLEKF